MSSFFRSSAVAIPTPGAPADWRRSAAWLFVAGLVQATVLHYVSIRGAVPSVIFIVVAVYAVRAGLLGAILFGLAGGLLEDALAGNTGAAWTISTTLVAIVISLSSRVLFTDSPSIFTAIVAGGVLLREALFWAVLSLEGYPTGLGLHYAKIAIANSAYTTLAVVIALWASWRFQPTR